MPFQFKSPISFGPSGKFPGGRAKGQLVGGQGSTREAAAKAQKYAGRIFRRAIESGKLVRAVAGFAIGEIRRRTLAGSDYQGKPFERYSEGYLKWKAAQGKHKGRVNMQLDGYMLDNMYGKTISSLKVEIRVRPFAVPGENINTEQLAKIHNEGLGRQPERKWFAWSNTSAEEGRVQKFARKYIEQEARRVARG